jgi:glycyl-tRNA synthetase beta subunit
VLRILADLPLDLVALIDESAASFAPACSAAARGPLFDFMLERLRNQLREAGHAQDVVDAVLALKPIDLVVPKLQAVVAFQQLPEAAALAAANKRIVNILKKAEGTPGEPDVALLAEDAEKALFHAIVEVAPLAAPTSRTRTTPTPCACWACGRGGPLLRRGDGDGRGAAGAPEPPGPAGPAGRPDEPGGGHLPPVGLSAERVP